MELVLIFFWGGALVDSDCFLSIYFPEVVNLGTEKLVVAV